MIYRTQKQLDAALKVWQKRLRLQDWDFKASIVDADNLGKNIFGRCDWDWRNKEAHIRLAHPEDWPDWYKFEKDMEKVLVHELLHCLIGPFEPDAESDDYELMEQAVESLAKSFVEMSRG